MIHGSLVNILPGISLEYRIYYIYPVFRGSIILVFMLLLPSFALSWGKQGRHLVVGVAHGLLDKKVTDMVDHYLGTSSWQEASDWLETSVTPRNADVRKQWQKVLIPRDKTYVPVKTPPNLVNQLEYQLMVIEKRSMFPAKDVSEALKIVFSLVSSAHQPLRCGYPDDLGGASVKVSYAGKTSTLLKLWDDDLLELRKCDMWDCSKKLLGMPQKDRMMIESAKVSDWVAESRSHLKEVYSIKNGVADDAYLDRAKPIAQMQIVKAGLRLAAILNKYFKD
jgi:hypothetical protein